MNLDSAALWYLNIPSVLCLRRYHFHPQVPCLLLPRLSLWRSKCLQDFYASPSYRTLSRRIKCFLYWSRVDNNVLVSGVLYSDSVIYMYVYTYIHTYICVCVYIYIYTHMYFFQILFPYRLLQNIEYSSLCYTVGPILVSYLFNI